MDLQSNILLAKPTPEHLESNTLLGLFLFPPVKRLYQGNAKSIFSIQPEELERMKKHPVYSPPFDFITYEGDYRSGYVSLDGLNLPSTGFVNFGLEGYGSLFAYYDDEPWDEKADIIFFRRIYSRPKYIHETKSGHLYKVMRVVIGLENGAMLAASTTQYFNVDEVTGIVTPCQDDRILSDPLKVQIALEFQKYVAAMFFESMRLLMESQNWMQLNVTTHHGMKIVQPGNVQFHHALFTHEGLRETFGKDISNNDLLQMVLKNRSVGAIVEDGEGGELLIRPGKHVEQRKILIHRPREDSSMNQTKVNQVLQSHSNIARKVFGCLQPDTDYTLKTVYSLMRKDNKTTHNHRAIKAAVLDLVDSGLVIKQGESLHKVKVTNASVPAPTVVKQAPPVKKEVVKSQHAKKISAPPKPAMKTPEVTAPKKPPVSPPQVNAPASIPEAALADWISSFIYNDYTTYNPAGKDFVMEGLTGSGPSKNLLLRAASVGDVIRYPAKGLIDGKSVYSRFGYLIRELAPELRLGFELHAFRGYVDVHVVPFERSFFTGRTIASEDKIRSIMMKSKPEDLVPPALDNNPIGWTVSMTTRDQCDYNPWSTDIVMARGATEGTRSHSALRKLNCGQIMRYRRDDGLTSYDIIGRFSYVLKTYSKEVGYMLEAHAFRDYIDIYVTNVPCGDKDHVLVTSLVNKTMLNAYFMRGTGKHVQFLDEGNTENIQAQQPAKSQEPAVVEVPDVSPTTQQPQPVSEAAVKAADSSVVPSESELNLWQSTFQKLLDQNVDSDEAIERATRAVEALRKLRGVNVASV